MSQRANLMKGLFDDVRFMRFTFSYWFIVDCRNVIGRIYRRHCTWVRNAVPTRRPTTSAIYDHPIGLSGVSNALEHFRSRNSFLCLVGDDHHFIDSINDSLQRMAPSSRLWETRRNISWYRHYLYQHWHRSTFIYIWQLLYSSDYSHHPFNPIHRYWARLYPRGGHGSICNFPIP